MAAPRTAVEGRMIMYGDDPSRQMAVFMAGRRERCVVVVGGQADNFFSHHSMRLLLQELETAGYSTVQTQLASSFVGCSRTHVGDAEDLQKLLRLLENDFEMKEITLFAFSSGVQVVLEYLSFNDSSDLVTRVILQGVVNDPNDYLFSEECVAKRTELVAELMAAGRKEEIVPGNVYDIKMTAARLSTGGLPSLQEAVWIPANKDDRQALQTNLKDITVPLLLMFATSTVYVPSAEIRSRVRDVVAASAATPELDVNFFEAAGDENRLMLRGSEAAHTAAIVTFLKECDRRRDERDEAARQAAAEEMRRSRSILAKSLLKGS